MTLKVIICDRRRAISNGELEKQLKNVMYKQAKEHKRSTASAPHTHRPPPTPENNNNMSISVISNFFKQKNLLIFIEILNIFMRRNFLLGGRGDYDTAYFLFSARTLL